MLLLINEQIQATGRVERKRIIQRENWKRGGEKGKGKDTRRGLETVQIQVISKIQQSRGSIYSFRLIKEHLTLLPHSEDVIYATEYSLN